MDEKNSEDDLQLSDDELELLLQDVSSLEDETAADEQAPSENSDNPQNLSNSKVEIPEDIERQKQKVIDLLSQVAEESEDRDETDEAPEDINIEDELKRINELFQENADDDELQDNEFEDLDLNALIDEIDSIDFDKVELEEDNEALDETTDKEPEEDEFLLEFNEDEQVDDTLLQAIQDEIPHIEEETLPSIENEEIEKEEEKEALPSDLSEPVNSATPSLVDDESEDASSDFEYEQEDEEEYYYDDDEEDQEAQKRVQTRRMITLGTLILFISAAIGFGCFTVIRSRNASYELMAARGLADVMMALAHARVMESKPDYVPPDDPDIIAHELEVILNPSYLKLSPINSSARFTDPSYNLRVFSKNDFSKYVLIAEPTPSFLQRLFPKAAIIATSHDMSLYKSKDLYPWLKLFIRNPQLENIEIPDINNLSKQEELVRLSSLNGSNSSQGFEPPRELSYVRPGTENLLYNAPRYYRFTKELIDLSLNLDAEASQPISDMANRFNAFPGLICYVAGEKEVAEIAARSLQLYAPTSPLLVGQVSLGLDNQFISNSSLISDIQLDELPKSLTEAVSDFSYEEEQKEESTEGRKVDDESRMQEKFSTHHPFYTTMLQWRGRREAALQPLALQMTQLVNEHSQAELPNFVEQHSTLFSSYQSVAHEQHEWISDQLVDLYARYVQDASDEVAEAFFYSVRATSLENYIPSSLRQREKLSEEGLPPRQQASSYIKEVPGTRDLLELHDLVSKTIVLLTPNNISNPNELISLQDELRTVVLRAIGRFLLSPESQLSPETFQSENRVILDDILSAANINDEEEREFYLQEFDILMEKYRVISKDRKTAVELRRPSTPDPETVEQSGVLREELARIPLSSISADSDLSYQENSGRIGQQIIIEQLSQKPSTERDEALWEVLSLLQQDTENNRGLWGDILEAYRMLTETPNKEIIEVVYSNLGFQSGTPPLHTNIRTAFEEYLVAKRSLSQITDPTLFIAQRDLFLQTQTESLKQVIADAQTIQSKTRVLNESLDTFLNRLNDYVEQYEVARSQGYFVENRSYHSILLGTVADQIKKIEKLKRLVSDVTKQLTIASRQHKALALQELARLETSDSISPEDVSVLQQRNNQIQYPNLLADNLGEKLLNALEVNIPSKY